MEADLDNQHSPILDEPWHKIRHDYKQLHSFAKAAIFVEPHNIVTPYSCKEAMAGSQAKEKYAVCKSKYDSQVTRGILTIKTLPYEPKAIEEIWVLNSKTI